MTGIPLESATCDYMPMFDCINDEKYQHTFDPFYKFVYMQVYAQVYIQCLYIDAYLEVCDDYFTLMHEEILFPT